MLTQDQLLVKTLGPCRIPSPLQGSKRVVFVNQNNRVRYHDKIGSDVPVDEADLSFEEAGPQPMIFFEPARTTAAIVTCGGLSPGLNNVIRAVYSELKHNYGVSRILGIRDGYQGLNPAVGQAPIELTREFVEDIDKLGGTVLGTSRGPQQPPVVVDFLEDQGIDILFCIGGDGTQRGAHAIAEEISRRGLRISVIGIPKTIDNDIPFVWITFGYQTSLQEAEKVLRGAHVEAKGAPNGIAVVKLMGRHAGFIAAGASIASDEANFVLVPEVPFPLDGDEGLLEMLGHRMQRRGHALIVVAEGAGQHLAADPEANVQRDASGNVRFEDIGVFLCHRIKTYFTGIGVSVSVKYIDPSYVIRSVPANTWDRILANQMGRFAAHAGMAGRTDTLIGLLHNELIHVPLTTVTSHKRQLDLQSDLWMAVLSSTGQPRWCG
ncbi:MAG: ATP-dependent 6-phosphofructokinase [Planctomycetaceae bacterium]|nr:MAG: ATP-dependent 6-phosphofructokinase [Planctomycetaceae bacterium]